SSQAETLGVPSQRRSRSPAFVYATSISSHNNFESAPPSAARISITTDSIFTPCVVLYMSNNNSYLQDLFREDLLEHPRRSTSKHLYLRLFGTCWIYHI